MTIHTELDVLGVGNAIVDILCHVRENVIEHLGLEKNAMTLIDLKEADRLYPHMTSSIECSGGSCANTMAAIAALSGNAAYVGRVRNDQFGKVFSHDLISLGVEYSTPFAQEGAETGRCLIFVTPDSRRTMQTYLGSCIELSPEDLDPDQIMRAKITYIEGYTWDSTTAQKTSILAATIAKQAGKKVALTLSDHFLVKRHQDSYKSFIKNYCDIVFANENEARSLAGTDNTNSALETLQGMAEIVIVTFNEKGSIILTPTARIPISAEPVLNVIDSTGAGDFYAAGFLFGLAHKYSLQNCGDLASQCAASVIQHLGARPEENLLSLIA
ncbi:Adenosine kinase [Candidatus Bealeia paramacronuclearis]|uniref:Adenosine kinase n=1 Tax=Candidatus Bealeia paramacronuclearis TaxID=1921001 RepID=A0ABZ2C0L5_9PROT|nr:Adenosine kinase [Candidatus Bealeia paramacronuclearis]